MKKHHCKKKEPEAVTVTHAGKDELPRACKIQWKQAGIKPSRDIKQCSLRRDVVGGRGFSESLLRELQKGWEYSALVGPLPSRGKMAGSHS